MLTDSHSHLDAKAFAGDRDQVVARAKEAGVGFIINASSDLASCQVSLELAERYPTTVAKLAQMRGESPETIAESTAQNACRLFGLPISEKGNKWNWQLSISLSKRTCKK